MNTKILSLLVFSIFLFSSVSAVVFDAEWDGGHQTATITNGQSISLNIPDGGSMHPPTTMKIILNSNVIYTKIINGQDISFSYIITPTNYNSQPGTYEIEVVGTDSIGSWLEELSLTVNPVAVPPVIPPASNNPPVITSSPVITVNEGNSYAYDVNAVDSEGNALTYSLVQSPGWLSINSATGLVSGVAPLVNSNTDYSIIVGVSDGINSVTQSYTLIVLNVQNPATNNPPVITSPSVTRATEKLEYDYQVIASDADGDTLAYSLVSAPSWLSVNSVTGFVHGTAPSVNENTDYSIVIQVSDGQSSDTQSYTLTVRDVSATRTTSGTTRVINDNPSDKNKYLSQFTSNTPVIPAIQPTQKTLGLGTTFLYIFMGLILFGIILAVYLLVVNIRQR